MKSQYAKPTVTKLGSVKEQTQGGWKAVYVEVMSWRGANGSGN
ncbi:MAG: lasso RiPP family leader peptide-containing protein [Gemmatimonadales bacterium]